MRESKCEGEAWLSDLLDYDSLLSGFEPRKDSDLGTEEGGERDNG